MTKREAILLEAQLGQRLEWIDITSYGDAETMVLMMTPKCAYCGVFNPTGHCRSCGASVVRAGQFGV